MAKSSSKHTSDTDKPSVRATYTFEYVSASLKAQRASLTKNGGLTSYRKIAKKYGVSCAVIHRIVAYGMEPKDPDIREALGMARHQFVEVAPCQKCGGVHMTKRCTDKSQPTKYPAHPVMRLSKLRQRIAELHFSPEIRSEIERELLA